MSDKNKYSAIDDELLERTKELEGFKEYMYLDSRGNPTVGIGRLVSGSDEAKRLPFRIGYGEDYRYSTGTETEDGFKKIKDRPYGQGIKASEFEPKSAGLSNLYIVEADAKRMLKQDLDRAQEQLHKKFPDFQSFPRKAQHALIDMEFNLGTRKFETEVYDNKGILIRNEGWPKLFKAVRKRDWIAAGDESHRQGPSEERNAKIKKLFYDAVEK